MAERSSHLLRMASRLAYRASLSVQQLRKADKSVDRYEAIIQDPVYIEADIVGIYDWNVWTTTQIQLDGATRPMPQGKVIGVCLSIIGI